MPEGPGAEGAPSSVRTEEPPDPSFRAEGRRPPWFGIVLAVIAAAGATLLLIGTRPGIGITPDSVTYVAVARNLLDGHGLYDPFAHHTLVLWPPLYPAVLAAGGAAIGVESWARWLGALLLGANVVLAGLLALEVTRSRVASLVAAALCATGVGLLAVHGWAWSDPLFMGLASASLLLLLRALRTGSRALVIAAGAAAALAGLTRYASPPLILVGVAALLFASSRPRKARVTHAALFAGVAAAPVILWLVRNSIVADGATGRSLGFHPPGFDPIVAAIRTAGAWFGLASMDEAVTRPSFWGLPGWFPAVLVPVAAAAVGAIVAWRTISGRTAEVPSGATAGVAAETGLATPEPGWAPMLIVGGYAIAYAAYLAFTITFVDAAVGPDIQRQVATVFVPGIVVAVGLGHRVLHTAASGRSRPARIAGAGIAAAAAVLLAISVRDAASWANEGFHARRGYGGPPWTTSALLARVRDADPSRPVYSNIAAAVTWVTGRQATPLPGRVDAHADRPNPRYAAALGRIRTVLEERHGLVVLMAGTSGSPLPSTTELERRLGLVVVLREPNGIVLVPAGQEGV